MLSLNAVFKIGSKKVLQMENEKLNDSLVKLEAKTKRTSVVCPFVLKGQKLKIAKEAVSECCNFSLKVITVFIF